MTLIWFAYWVLFSCPDISKPFFIWQWHQPLQAQQHEGFMGPDQKFVNHVDLNLSKSLRPEMWQRHAAAQLKCGLPTLPGWSVLSKLWAGQLSLCSSVIVRCQVSLRTQNTAIHRGHKYRIFHEIKLRLEKERGYFFVLHLQAFLVSLWMVYSEVKALMLILFTSVKSLPCLRFSCAFLLLRSL